MNEELKQEEEELRALLPWAKSWKRLYVLVLCELIVTIGLLYLFSRVFA